MQRILASILAATATATATGSAQTSDIPKDFVVRLLPEDFVKRIEMIPMRDGVKLKTYILIRKGAKNAAIILERTPYDAGNFGRNPDADPLFQAGYIRAYQDVRGKYGSEGDYVMTRPVRGPLNSTTTDHSTDTWDTIDWLVKNLPESNGRVGMIGGSYDGFTAVMGLLDPHPALRAAVPQGPVLDGWMGDDWFHYGAFRNMMLGYIHSQTAQRGAGVIPPSDTYDKYEEFLRAGSTGDYIRANGLEKLPWIARAMAHPAYDAYWQGQAVDQLVAARPSTVPTLWTQGLWDQEDMWGANHAWRALKAAGHETNNWLVLGPWNHIQVHGLGSSLGPMSWGEETARIYRRDMLLPFFDEHLRDGPPAKLARVAVYNTGEKRWERFSTWPTACDRGCASPLKPLYLSAGFGLSFDPPSQPDGGDQYTSDPAKPVPFLPRPVVDPFVELGAGSLGSPYEPWSKWLVWDQRFVEGRPDVLAYETPILPSAVRVQGTPIADIRAQMTGTDVDFVVKLIDVFPGEDPVNPQASGYQLPISLDIFRGRYRESFERPIPTPANTPQRYRFELPNVNHVFQPGHRIMVQIQSTLFPLYDRNPQTFVPNIFDAKPADYRKSDITVLRSKAQSSAILLPVID
jgi:putative CocE/NonD family hydrolase